MRRYVAVTGMGAVTPIGNSLSEIWSNIEKSYCGIDFIKSFDTTNSQVKIAAEIKDLKLEDYLDRKAMRRMDRVNQLFCWFHLHRLLCLLNLLSLYMLQVSLLFALL